MSLYHKAVVKCVVSFSDVTFKFPGNGKFPGYREIVEKNFDLLSSTCLLLCLQVHFLRAHLGALQNDMSEEHGERS